MTASTATVSRFAVLGALGAALAWPAPAHATFPGTDGDLVFQVTRSGTRISAARVTPPPHGQAPAATQPQSLGLPGYGFQLDHNFAPDGSRVVYTVFDPRNTTQSSLRIAWVRGSGSGGALAIPPVAITVDNNGQSYTTEYYPRHPAFTPDGAAVVFSQAGHIRRYELATGAITDLSSAASPPTDHGSYYWPTVSADGTTVACQVLSGIRVGGPAGLATLPMTGARPTVIAPDLVIPTWHPYRHEMLAVRPNGSAGTRDFVRLLPDGTATTLYTAPGFSVGGDTDLGRYRVVYSPTGTRIAFTILNDEVTDSPDSFGNSLYTLDLTAPGGPQRTIVATLPSVSGDVWMAVRPTWGVRDRPVEISFGPTEMDIQNHRDAQSIPGPSYNSATLSYDFATLYGAHRTPVTVRALDPTGAPLSTSITLSVQVETFGTVHPAPPALVGLGLTAGDPAVLPTDLTVQTDAQGTATVWVSAVDLYAGRSAPSISDLRVTARSAAGISHATLEVRDNFRTLRERYEAAADYIPEGATSAFRRGLRAPLDAIANGAYLIEYLWYSGNLNTAPGTITCNRYQGMVLVYLNDVRHSPEDAWLVNGIDYGPVQTDPLDHHFVRVWTSRAQSQTPEEIWYFDPWLSQSRTAYRQAEYHAFFHVDDDSSYFRQIIVGDGLRGGNPGTCRRYCGARPNGFETIFYPTLGGTYPFFPENDRLPAVGTPYQKFDGCLRTPHRRISYVDPQGVLQQEEIVNWCERNGYGSAAIEPRELADAPGSVVVLSPGVPLYTDALGRRYGFTSTASTSFVNDFPASTTRGLTRLREAGVTTHTGWMMDLPAAGPFRLDFVGTEPGTLDIIVLGPDGVPWGTYEDVPVTQGSTGFVDVDLFSACAPLTLGGGGNVPCTPPPPCMADPLGDQDADLACDSVDNCRGLANAAQIDADADGIGDACDPCVGPDGDGDGVCDLQDNCPLAPNPDQFDPDGDAIGFACDACPEDPINDPDGDQICAQEYECDFQPCDPYYESCCDPYVDPSCCTTEYCPGGPFCQDNCPTVLNPQQDDLDQDGIGDACDVCPFDYLNQCSGGDADGDGTADTIDGAPCDPRATAAGFAPGYQTFGVIAFEDLWPGPTDLDFNDVVLGYSAATKYDNAFRATGLRLSLEVLALGGELDNGLGWQLPVPAERVASVTLYVEGQLPVPLPLSTADANATVTIAPNLRDLFGGQPGPINSVPGVLTPSVSLVVDVQYATPAYAGFGAPWDLFIFRAGDPTHQIHRPEYPGTAAMDPALFGQTEDGSTPGRWFVNTRGLPYALVFPDPVAYPAEGVDISLLYPGIVGFAASGGAQNADFYTAPAPGYGFTDAAGVAAQLSGALPAIDRSCLP